MSTEKRITKYDKYIVDPVIKFIDDDGVEQTYEFHPPVLDDYGNERVSDVSLVAVADLRPMSLGERVRRYMRTPQLQHDLMNDAGMDMDDENFPDTQPDDSAPMSLHEDRAHQLRKDQENARLKKIEEDKKAATEAEIEAEKQANEAFRRRYKQLKESGSLPD